MNQNHKGIIELIFGIIDRLITAKDGSSRAYNIIVMLIIFFIGFTAYQWEDLRELYKETKYEVYQKDLEAIRSQAFMSMAQQQLQILYVNSRADLVLIYEYYPPNQHFFFNTLFYEGKLPDGIGIEEIQDLPIDKTTIEYISHLSGLPYESDSNFNFLPKSLSHDFKYVFSCPIFNLDNVYSGSVAMIWYEDPQFSEERKEDIHSLCFHSTRVLGRAK